jgi:hypothetical protein
MTPDTRSDIRVSALCAGGVGGSLFLASCFRVTMARVFNSEWGENFQARAAAVAVVSVSCAFIWFLFVWLCLVCSSCRALLNSPKFGSSRKSVSVGGRSEFRLLGYVASSALVLACTLLIILDANDYVFVSRSLPWIPSLVWLQTCGFRFAYRVFPCQNEGSHSGCEAYKWSPAFVLSNAVVYFPFLFVGALLCVRSPYIQLVWPRIWRSIIRYGALVGSLALCTRLFVYNLEPSLAVPARPLDLVHWAWIVFDNVTGITALILFLLVPFSLYRLLLALRIRTGVRSEVVELTWLASFIAAALVLSSQFLANG